MDFLKASRLSGLALYPAALAIEKLFLAPVFALEELSYHHVGGVCSFVLLRKGVILLDLWYCSNTYPNTCCVCQIV